MTAKSLETPINATSNVTLTYGKGFELFQLSVWQKKSISYALLVVFSYPVLGSNPENKTCMADCPCMQNCPNGCLDCPHELCPCADNGGEDYQTCADFFEAQFWLCAKNCDHDEACFSACNREYDRNLLKCPCQAGCPNGKG